MPSLFLLLLGLGCCAPAMGTARTSTKLTASVASHTHMAAGAESGGPGEGGSGSHAHARAAWAVGSVGQLDMSTDEGQRTQGQEGGSTEALSNPASGQRQQQQQQQQVQLVHRRLQQEGQRAGERRGGGDGNDEESPPGHDGKDRGDTGKAEVNEGEGSSYSSFAGASSGPAAGSETLSFPSSRRCVFILGTGRSGSTALMDALNQLPHFLIRGEQEGAFWFLYLTYRCVYEAGTSRRS